MLYCALLMFRGSSIIKGVQGSSSRRLKLLLLLLLLLLSSSPRDHMSVIEGATLKAPLHLICTTHDALPPLATMPATCDCDTGSARRDGGCGLAYDVRCACGFQGRRHVQRNAERDGVNVRHAWVQ